jgi:hypothetical protein
MLANYNLNDAGVLRISLQLLAMPLAHSGGAKDDAAGGPDQVENDLTIADGSERAGSTFVGFPGEEDANDNKGESKSPQERRVHGCVAG